MEPDGRNRTMSRGAAWQCCSSTTAAAQTACHPLSLRTRENSTASAPAHACFRAPCSSRPGDGSAVEDRPRGPCRAGPRRRSQAGESESGVALERRNDDRGAVRLVRERLCAAIRSEDRLLADWRLGSWRPARLASGWSGIEACGGSRRCGCSPLLDQWRRRLCRPRVVDALRVCCVPMLGRGCGVVVVGPALVVCWLCGVGPVVRGG
jgi:hypothetical protein